MSPASRPSSFWPVFVSVTLAYLAFVLVLLGVMAGHSSPADLWAAMQSREIQHAVVLSFGTCTLAALLSLVVAIPAGYLLARGRHPVLQLVEAMLDIPIVLPPMVVGLALLIFFQSTLGRAVESLGARFTYTVAGIVLAQWVIGTAFATRTLRGTFGHLSSRPEQVARTLGCSPWGAFLRIALPSALRGVVAGGSVAWARGLGEFGPILVFAGAMRMRTEVLPTTVWLELSVGNLDAAVAVSILLVATAFVVLVLVRFLGVQVVS